MGSVREQSPGNVNYEGDELYKKGVYRCTDQGSEGSTLRRSHFRRDRGN